MSVHYRRRPLSRRDEIGALSVSILAGLGGAAAAYYLTRLFLSREKLDPPDLSPARNEALGQAERRTLSAPGGTSDPSG